MKKSQHASSSSCHTIDFYFTTGWKDMDEDERRQSIGGGRSSLESVDNNDYSSLDNIAEDYEKNAAYIQVSADFPFI